jgi:hypothetical protein
MAKKQQQLSAADVAAQSQLQEEFEVQKAFEAGITTLRDLISPSSIEIHSDYFRLGTKYGRTIYVYGYPRSLITGWLSSVINIDEVLDISMYIYPVDTGVIMKNLTKKVTQLEASMSINQEKGKFAIQSSRLPSPMLRIFAINSKSAPKNSSDTVFM